MNGPGCCAGRGEGRAIRSSKLLAAAVVHGKARAAAVLTYGVNHARRGIITADHGNCELMAEADGTPFTAHTTSPVPLILIDPAYKGATLREGGKLSDVAPTMLKLMGLPQPSEMTGESLV